MTKSTGKIKFFDNKKGYGFIANPDGGDLFCHYSDILDQEGYKTLTEGDQVEYLAVKADKGWAAKEISLLSPKTPHHAPGDSP